MADDPDRYVAAYQACVPHGHDRYVIELPDSVPEVIGAELAQPLIRCREFRRLDEHASALAASIETPLDRMRARIDAVDARGLPPAIATLIQRLRDELVNSGESAIDRDGARERIRERLAQMAERGLLISEGDCLLEHDRRVPGAAQADTISSLGVVTRDRPESLLRCLDSLSTMLARSGRRLRLVVADDSTDERVRQRNRETLERISARLGVDARYLGADEKTALCDQLAARSGAPRSSVEFALRPARRFAMGAGANRNCLLLATQGDLTFQVDDDIHWRLAAAPGMVPGLRFVPAGDPTVTQFFPDRAAALAAVPSDDGDGIAMHERVLGRSLGAGIAAMRAPDRPIVDGAIDPVFLRHLRHGRGRAMATSFGIVGDIGTWSPHTLFDLSGQSWDNLLARYDDAARTREVVRAAPQATVTRGGFFMAGAVGLDNRVFLPPFFPAGRNEDGLFGVLLPFVAPDSYFCHLPAVIAHEPETTRAFDPAAAWTQAGSLRVVELVLNAVRTWRPSAAAATPPARLVALGTYLEEVGAMAVDTFVELQQFEAWRMMDIIRRGIQDRLRSSGKLPPNVADALTRHFVLLEARMSSDRFLQPIDLPGDGTIEDRLGRVQALIAEYGRLLQVWPSLIDAADDLSDG